MLNKQPGQRSYLTKIRNVALLPQERVSHVFAPQKGLVAEPWGEGQLLIATDERIISFSSHQGSNETYMVPVTELKGVVVRYSSEKNPGSLMQGLLLLGGALAIYVILSYWLTARVTGPNVPLINVDLGPLVILLLILLGGWLLARYFFSSGNGSATFRGTNWSFEFPFSGETSEDDLYEMVNAMFILRGGPNKRQNVRQNSGDD